MYKTIQYYQHDIRITSCYGATQLKNKFEGFNNICCRAFTTALMLTCLLFSYNAPLVDGHFYWMGTVITMWAHFQMRYRVVVVPSSIFHRSKVTWHDVMARKMRDRSTRNFIAAKLTRNGITVDKQLQYPK